MPNYLRFGLLLLPGASLYGSSPLPYPHPEQLVTLHMTKPNFETGAIPFPIFRDWQAQNRTFSAMALSRNNSINLIGAGETEYLLMNYVTSDFFSMTNFSERYRESLICDFGEIGKTEASLRLEERIVTEPLSFIEP